MDAASAAYLIAVIGALISMIGVLVAWIYTTQRAEMVERIAVLERESFTKDEFHAARECISEEIDLRIAARFGTGP